jgi:transcriptional regulator with XRE-family HTH domain
MAKRVVVSKRPDSSKPLDVNTIGEWVRFARTSEGLKLQEAADICNINHATLSDIENGKGTAKIETLFHVLKMLGLELKTGV